MTQVTTANQPTNDPRRCGIVKADGSRCRAYKMSGKETCFWHSPDAAASRAAAASRGGLARQGRKLGEVDSWHDVPSVDLDVLMQLQRAQDTLLAMEPSISQARALCYLASITLARDAAAELEELAARIAALEEVGK